jgi:hypothetical protein
MFSENYQITFADGREQTVTSTQRDLADVDVAAGRRNIFPPAGKLLMITYPWLVIRMRAWLAYRRETGQDIAWEAFDADAVEVVAVGGDPDPTQSDTQDGSSPPSPSEQE